MKEPRDFERIIVANQGGAPVYLSQVAEVVDGEAEEQSISRVNGLRSVSLDVMKIQQANIVQVGQGVDEAIAELKTRLPSDIQIETLWSDAKFIQGSLDRVKETILEGAGLTINFVRSLAAGGFADLHHHEFWDIAHLSRADGTEPEFRSRPTDSGRSASRDSASLHAECPAPRCGRHGCRRPGPCQSNGRPP